MDRAHSRNVQAPWVARDAALTPPLHARSAPSPGARAAEGGRLLLALVPGAAVAFVGGLVWAGVVIATHWDFGPLAWFIGAATGGTVLFFAGAPVHGLARGLTASLAVAGIIVGKYVITVYEITMLTDAERYQHGLSTHYLDTRNMAFFIHPSVNVTRPIYFLWFLIAWVGAFSVVGGRRTLAGRRRVA